MAESVSRASAVSQIEEDSEKSFVKTLIGHYSRGCFPRRESALVEFRRGCSKGVHKYSRCHIIPLMGDLEQVVRLSAALVGGKLRGDTSGCLILTCAV